MPSFYKVVDIIGTSPNSWEEAAATVIAETAAKVYDLRIAEVKKLDVQIDDGKVVNYRVKLGVSFRLHDEM